MRYILTIIGFLSIVIAVQCLLLYFALSTKTSLVEEHGFEKGLRYQETIDALSLAMKRNVTAVITQEKRDESSLLRVRFTVAPNSSEPVAAAANPIEPRSVLLQGRFTKTDALDFTIPLTPCESSEDGIQSFCATHARALSGLWMIDITAKDTSSNQTMKWSFRQLFE